MPDRNELALQIAVLAKIHPEWSTSQIAQALGWAPLFIINALSEGEAMELFKQDLETDKLELVGGHPLMTQPSIYSMGKELARLTDEILYVIAAANKREEDVSMEQLEWSWLSGLPKAQLELAVETLEFAELITEYKMNDPYDEDSVYTFLTLVSSADNRWGSKQFKPRTKASKKRQKKERGEK